MEISAYLAAIIGPLLAKPEEFALSQTTDEMGVLFKVTVAKEDMGVIIGKAGETAKCIRHLIRIAGVRQGARVAVKINEPDGTSYTPRSKENFNK